MTESNETDHPADWAFQRAYWEANYTRRPYVVLQYGFAYYEPAYRYGVEAAQRHRAKPWEDIEAELQSGWETPGQRWRAIKGAVRDAWDRVTGQES